MTPVTVWTLTAGLGMSFDLYNMVWALIEVRRATKSNGSLMAGVRRIVGRHRFTTEVLQLIAQGGFFYIGVKFWGAEGRWDDFTTVLVVASALITVNAIRAASHRVRMERERQRIERMLAERTEE